LNYIEFITVYMYVTND